MNILYFSDGISQQGQEKTMHLIKAGTKLSFINIQQRRASKSTRIQDTCVLLGRINASVAGGK